MLKDVDVVLDMPFYFIWKELLDVFPECKVIFYERDEDEWFKSYASQARRVTARVYNIWLFFGKFSIFYYFCNFFQYHNYSQ